MILVCVLLGLSVNGVTSAQVYFGYPARRVPIYSVATTEKKVAISFDAAWGADKTEKIMEICKDFNVNATFFLVGFWVDKYPELTNKIASQGFEIGTHSNTHPDMTKLDRPSMKAELQTCVSMIEKSAQCKVKLFRPPYGAYNNTLIEVSEELGLTTIQWSVDSLDWKGLSAENITTRVMNGVKNGSIILCHNNSDHILEALPLMLDRLKNMGYKITNIGDLIIKNNFQIDKNGVQKANS
ncbi:MAG: polysaccharide deacetylase family protein [Clostridia bacterium]